MHCFRSKYEKNICSKNKSKKFFGSILIFVKVKWRWKFNILYSNTEREMNKENYKQKRAELKLKVIFSILQFLPFSFLVIF